MKYGQYLVYISPSMGSYVKIYDTGTYLIQITFATGSGIDVYTKPEYYLDDNYTIRNSITKNVDYHYWGVGPETSNHSSGWFYMQETDEEGIERNIHKLTHPQQKIWYRKILPEPVGAYTSHKISYTDDDLPDTIKNVESRIDFYRWV